MSYFSEVLTWIVQSAWKWWTRDKNIDSYKEMSFFGVKYVVFIENEINFWKILSFAIHGLMTISNKWSKFQNDLINIQGDMASKIHILLE